MTDDKCHRCANWTREAAKRYGGKFEDGTDLNVCECDDEDEDDEDAGDA